ncbi:ABC transporter ATP-binding protein [Paenibacillus ginsengarvi]|uniref:ABC transporter ATP-binding protein n=1 Tax=Paenibacillus ginsengarvi TaxID=400777 RepID=A0A3B0ALG2_9BACL|nr:ABC transporter ATP-binding protein [Paenibacillus ginsengarvi]RKN61402.1 ABC transporter ATP-binding protein [Paenibacillus ginsengarvi]
MNHSVISLSGVQKSFETFRFGPFDLQIEPGVVAAFVGPNGSGKTTLFHMLMNVIEPDRGEIRIFGSEYGQNEVGIKRRIGYVADSTYIEEADSRIQEVASFHRHWFPSWSEAKWTELCDKFELNPKAKVKQLSKGMKRRLAFCLTLAQMPDLLILDEPSSGLDPYIWRFMMNEIQDFMKNGDKTVLIATHTIEEVRRLADYVAFMYNGKLLNYKEKDTLMDEWKALWIETPHAAELRLPGVVESEQGALTRLITRDVVATEQALRASGITALKRQGVELDEILHHMIADSKRGGEASGR